MEQKKNPKIDVNRKSGLFLNLGFILSLLLVITAFEWRFYDNLETIDLGTLESEETEILDIPIIDVPPPPPPVIQQPEIVEVPDDEEPEQEIEMELEVEIDEKIVTPPPVIIDAPPPPPPAPEEENTIFMIVEQPATPPGGMAAFYKYVAKEINYPKMARRLHVEGKVYVQFVVDKDGSLTDIKVVKGIGSGCDEEAIRVIKKAPKWNPGKQRGRPVRQRMSIPLIFQLR